MLLNSFGQPTLLTSNKTHLNFKDFMKAPLLLCHKNALNKKIIPKCWLGNMYGTQEIVNEIKQKKYTINPNHAQELMPNKIYHINVSDDGNFGKVKNIELTVIPWDKEYVVYLIKADNVTNLLTDMFTENMEVFVQNKILRNSIKTGIDVLYVNDSVYHNLMEFEEYPSEYLLGALATLVRPRFIHGFSEYQMPLHITNCCVGNSIV